MLRIIAGRFRGRRLQTPSGPDTRPTADAMRETVYNVLGDAVRAARVADLFAGSGSLGLEALSRGARAVVFVEQAPAALAVLRDNIAALGAQGESRVVRADAVGYLGGSALEPFDVMLADPPYALGAEDGLLQAARDRVVPGGWLVLQHGKQWQAPAELPGWQRGRPRRFGDTTIEFFVREEAGDGADGALSGDV